MTQYIIFAAIFLILESIHDAFVIEGRKKFNIEYDKWWHKVDVLVKSWMVIGILYFWGVPAIWAGVLYFCLFFCARAWLFNLSLNVVRYLLGAEIALFHLGKTGIEGWFVKHKVSWLYWLSALVLTIILIVI